MANCALCKGQTKDTTLFTCEGGTRGICRTCAWDTKGLNERSSVGDTDLEASLPLLLKRAALDPDDVTAALDAGEVLDRLGRKEEACVHWRRAGHRFLAEGDEVGALITFGNVLDRVHPGLASDHEAFARANEMLGSKEEAMASFARAAELREAESGGAAAAALKARIAELKPDVKKHAAENARKRRESKERLNAEFADLLALTKGTPVADVRCEVCGQDRPRAKALQLHDATPDGTTFVVTVCYACIDEALATLPVPDVRAELGKVLAALDASASATIWGKLEGVPIWTMLDSRPNRARFRDANIHEPRPDRAQAAAFLAAADAAPRQRALGCLWLGTCRNPADLPVLEAVLDSTESAGLFPCVRPAEKAWKPEDPVTWEACTVGEAALSALGLIHGRGFAGAKAYRQWRAALA